MFADKKPRLLMLIAAVLIGSILCAMLISKGNSHGPIFEMKPSDAATEPIGSTHEPTASVSELANESARPQKFNIDIGNQDIIRKCLVSSPEISRVRFNDDLTLERLVSDLTSDLHLNDSETIINVHVRRPSGAVQRLNVQPASSESRADDPQRYKIGNSDLRMFNVDDENLPVSIPFDESVKAESVAGVVSNFVSGGAVFFREKRMHRTFGDGSAPSVTADSVETNGRLNELQLFLISHSLGCAWQEKRLNCSCVQ